MVSKLSRLIFALILVALSLYIVILNREIINLKLSPSHEISTSGGVIFIAIFCAGVLATALVSALFGLKFYFKERWLINKERQTKLQINSILQARSAIACEDWQRAQGMWREIIRRDPNNIIARVELSRSLQGAGDAHEALRILDAARAVAPHNQEVLFRAAELNVAIGNKTAAVDNLALILYHQPVQRAAIMARDLSEQLGRFDDALEYNSRLEKLIGKSEQTELAYSNLQFKKIIAEHNNNQAELLTQLRAFVRRHSEFSPGLEYLAGLERQAGQIENSAQLLIKAGKLSGDLSLWKQAINLWSAAGLPDRASAAARSAVKETQGVARLEAQLELARLYLSLHMFADATKALENFETDSRASDQPLPAELEIEFFTLRGIALNAAGDFRESSDLWKKLAQRRESGSQDKKSRPAVALAQLSPQINGHQPAARLSTP